MSCNERAASARLPSTSVGPALFHRILKEEKDAGGKGCNPNGICGRLA